MDKDAIATLWGTIQYFVDPRVDVSNAQIAQQQAAAQVTKLNDRAEHLSSEIAKKRRMYDGIDHFIRKSAPAEERVKIQKALASLNSEIARDEALLQKHNQTSIYYVQAYCRDDVDRGYEAGNYRPRLLGSAVRDTAGHFQFRPG
jgi:hypothetical protein